MNNLKFISKNAAGRDFVVGDLHGCRSLLMLALERVAFNPEKDRVFCTGDLVDRGPESLATLCLIEEPWFYSVAGNHDDMLRQVLSGDCADEVAATFLANGGEWFFRLGDEELFYLKDVLQEKLKALPLVMRVDSDAGQFQVAHAELCAKSGKTLTDEILEFSHLSEFQPSIQWGRTRIEWAFDNLPTPEENDHGITCFNPGFETGLTLTYVGHSIVSGPVLFRSHLYIDGGASRSYRSKPGRLILVEHGTGKITSVNAFDLDNQEAA